MKERIDYMKKNIKKALLFILLIIVIICILFGVLYSKGSSNGIDNIADYENIFHSVDELKFYKNENNFYSTQSPAKDLKTIKKISLTAEPISEDRSKDRDFEYKIIVNGKFIIYINSDFSQLWLDDTQHINIDYNGNWNTETVEGILPSFSYSVENPELLQELFENHSQHIA